MVGVEMSMHFSTKPELMPSARLGEYSNFLVLYIEDNKLATTVLYFTDEQLQSLAAQVNGIAAQRRAKLSSRTAAIELQIDREMISPSEGEIIAAETESVDDPFPDPPTWVIKNPAEMGTVAA